MPATTPSRSAQIAAFVTFVQKLNDERRDRDLSGYPQLAADPEYVAANRRLISVIPGRRYAKVVATTRGQRSVYCFLDMTNGDILKAEGWKKPAKHARGSLDDPGTWPDAAQVYGAKYLR